MKVGKIWSSNRGVTTLEYAQQASIITGVSLHVTTFARGGGIGWIGGHYYTRRATR